MFKYTQLYIYDKCGSKIKSIKTLMSKDVSCGWCFFIGSIILKYLNLRAFIRDNCYM